MLLVWTTFLSPAQETQVQYLSGVDKDHTVPWSFKTHRHRASLINVQTNIPVPSCWDTQGFGNYQYGAGSVYRIPRLATMIAPLP